jgi:hypothetical protein
MTAEESKDLMDEIRKLYANDPELLGIANNATDSTALR